jgi:hypothetical protein
MSEKSKSVFETLNAINVNERTETKNKLTYLSWAWAWQIVKQNYPTSTYTIYEDNDGLFYHSDGRSAWVKTGVTIEGIEHIEYLPVFDFRNNSVPLEKLTSTDVNKTIQRSLTKAIARHGLGLYIYAGEDLPQYDNTAEDIKPSEKPKRIKLDIGDENWDVVLNYVAKMKDTQSFEDSIKNLQTKYDTITGKPKAELKKTHEGK